CMDSPDVQAVLTEAIGDDTTSSPVRAVSYGLRTPADWRASDISPKGVDRSSFMVEFRQEEWGTVDTGLAGVHNVSNSLAAVAVGEIIGLSPSTVAGAIGEFHGVRRRFQRIGEAGGVLVMDDYAHHPSEVRATLAAARSRFPDQRLVCLFQPHTYTRTRYLLDGFRTCFGDCDVLRIARTYAAREEPAAGMSAEELAREITDPPARYAGELDEAARAVVDILRPGDVFFPIGDGGVRGLTIENRTSQVEGPSPNGAGLRARVASGVSFAALARRLSSAGYGGIEWACGIPGSLGGAVVSNAGAYDHSLKDVLKG